MKRLRRRITRRKVGNSPIPLGPWPLNPDGKSITAPIRGDDWTTFDAPHYHVWSSRPWRKTTDGYAGVWVYDRDAKTGFWLLLHRVIANAPADRLVDHKQGDRLDNRRRQLRYATPSQNTANRTKLLPNKLSRYRGVTLHKSGKWQAQAKHRDKFVHGGLHRTEEAAARAYNRIARKLWGRFARLNVVTDQIPLDLNTATGAQAA